MDLLIDPYRVAPAMPMCVEYSTLVKQAQDAGGPNSGDGMVQSGAAIDSKNAFLATLGSYTANDLQHVTASTTTYYRIATPLVLWGGVGQLGSEWAGDNKSRVLNGTISAGNGRFNTSANGVGNWYEGSFSYQILLSGYYNAFGCFVTDLGDLGGQLSFVFYDGATVVKTVNLPTDPTEQPGPSNCMWVCYGDGNVQFNKIRAVITQLNPGNPTFWDGIGFDDFVIGQVTACTPA